MVVGAVDQGRVAAVVVRCCCRLGKLVVQNHQGTAAGTAMVVGLRVGAGGGDGRWRGSGGQPSVEQHQTGVGVVDEGPVDQEWTSQHWTTSNIT